MKILIIDCSNGNYVSLISGDKIFERKNDSKVSDEALKMINDCLTDAKIKTTDLDAIAVSIGPGSFTGIRVGLTIAKTMSFVSKIPLIAFTSFETIAYNNKGQRAVKGFSNFVYVDDGKKQNCVDKTEFEEKNKKEILVCEDLSLTHQKIVKIDREKVVLEKFNAKDFADAKTIEPLYLRLSQAEIERNKNGNKKG